MPYHVRITIVDELDELVVLDLSLDDLVNRVIAPYDAGKPIVLKGRTLLLQYVKQILISQTDQRSDEIIPRIIAKRANATVIGPISMPWEVANSGADVTDKFITAPPGSQSEAEKSKVAVQSTENARVVMVVHGRDERLSSSMFDFLRAIDLRPLEWSEAVAATKKATPYVGDVLDAAFGMAQAIVVLLTGDDIAFLRKDLQKADDKTEDVNPTPQARPNVLFEAGMAMATHKDRTLIVEIGNLRPFTDIGGRHVVRLDDSTEKRQEIIDRLETAGCTVNRSGTDWIKAGDFSAPDMTDAEPPLVAEPEITNSVLTQLEQDTLLLLSKTDDHGLTASFISVQLEVLQQKAQFVLGSLKDRGLVVYSLYMGKPTRWHLAQSGRKILVDKGLL